MLTFLVVIFAFVALAWMLFLPKLVTSQIRTRSGFDATIERLAVNPVSGTIEMKGFVLTNPPTFPIEDFLEVREFRASVRPTSLFSDNPIFDRMVVNAATVTLVKRKDGATNAEAFQGNLEDHDRKPFVASTSNRRPILIRRLDLQIDRLVIVDHSLREPTRREFTLNLHQSYTDVTRLDQLLEPEALKNLAPIAVAIGGLLPGEIGKLLTEVGSSSVDLLQQAGRKTGERVKGFFDALEESKKP
ncbi:MAG TPA: hypothetical protein VL069_03095 [Opitutus sp.]|nr:hypothetical protein [Opitutus sp.]